MNITYYERFKLLIVLANEIIQVCFILLHIITRTSVFFYNSYNNVYLVVFKCLNYVYNMSIEFIVM